MGLNLPMDRRVMWNLREIGLPEVPLFGAYKVSHAEIALPPHTHGDCIEIHYIQNGFQIFSIGEQLYMLRTGDVHITMPHELHGSGGKPLGHCVIYWLQLQIPKRGKSLCGLNAVQSRNLIQQLLDVPARHFHGNPRLANLFEEMFKLLKSGEATTQSNSFTTRLALWLTTVAESAQTKSKRSITADIRSILDRIDSDPGQCPSVSDLADTIGHSKGSFLRRFSTQVGISPYHYILDRKIALAVKRLTTTQITITELAAELNFSSSQHFATVFKQYMSVSPLAFRNNQYPTRNYPPEERVILP